MLLHSNEVVFGLHIRMAVKYSNNSSDSDNRIIRVLLFEYYPSLSVQIVCKAIFLNSYFRTFIFPDTIICFIPRITTYFSSFALLFSQKFILLSIAYFVFCIMSVGNVLITGANRGLGLEFVKQFLALPKPPVHLFATCRNPDTADELQKIVKSKPNVKVLKLDVKEYDEFPNVCLQIEQEVGDSGLNLLINNAGIMFPDNLDKVSKDNMMENFEVNAVSPLLLTKELLPLLKKAASRVNTKALSCTRAGVVNITSKMGSIDDNTSGGYYPYRASKTALNMVTKSLSVDLKPHGILAFVLHPGWVLTDMGGSNALITTETSVSGMVNTILNSSDEHCGLMLNYDGKKIAW